VSATNLSHKTSFASFVASRHNMAMRRKPKVKDTVEVAEEQKEPYVIAAEKGDVDELFSMLPFFKKDVNSPLNGDKKDTFLLIAASKDHLELLIKLIDNGADVNQANKDGLTPLHAAAQEGVLFLDSTH
jgi:ankyrin repeat protein